MPKRYQAIATVGLFLAGAACVSLNALTSMWIQGVCVSYAAGTGPHRGSGCTNTDAGLIWTPRLWMGLAGGVALIVLAAFLWGRLPRSLRRGAAVATASCGAVAAAVAWSEPQVGQAVNELLAAVVPGHDLR